MASVYAPNVVQVLLNFDYQSVPCQNTMYFLATAEPSTSDINGLCQAVFNAWEADAAPFCPSSVELRNVQGISLDQAGAPVGGYTPAVSAFGEDILPAAPNNVSMAVSFRTGYSGKSRRGRNYWIGLLEANVADNRLAGAVMTAILGYYTPMMGVNALLAGWVWGVYSRKVNGVDRLIGLFTPITQVLFVNDVVDTQRNRLP